MLRQQNQQLQSQLQAAQAEVQALQQESAGHLQVLSLKKEEEVTQMKRCCPFWCEICHRPVPASTKRLNRLCVLPRYEEDRDRYALKRVGALPLQGAGQSLLLSAVNCPPRFQPSKTALAAALEIPSGLPPPPAHPWGRDRVCLALCALPSRRLVRS